MAQNNKSSLALAPHALLVSRSLLHISLTQGVRLTEFENLECYQGMAKKGQGVCELLEVSTSPILLVEANHMSMPNFTGVGSAILP